MLQVKNLTTELFKSLNFEIRPGEIAFILGSSGAGKSSVFTLKYCAPHQDVEPAETQCSSRHHAVDLVHQVAQVKRLRQHLGILGCA